MQLHIKNIGPIGEAVIDLTGLTVIGGWNDTGKSTIGKTLFAIIKAIRTRDLEYYSIQEGRIDALTSSFSSIIRRTYSPSISPSIIANIVRRNIDIELIGSFEEAQRVEQILSDIKIRVLDLIYQRGISNSRLARPEGLFEDASPEEALEKFISNLRTLLLEKKDDQRMYAASLEKVIRTTFRGEVNNKRAKGVGGILLMHNDKTILSSTFEKNYLNRLDLAEGMLSELFEDATLLESPFVLNFRSSFNLFRGTYENPVVDYTTSDLLRKLTFATNSVTAKDEQVGNSLELNIATLIGGTIKGRIYFDRDRDDFIFQNDDKTEVRISNTASGVKTLGIMQMLAASGILSSANLLVIDEPEVHLHPRWQLVCADVIATLVAKYNVYCVVSSHSPYFLQALEAYIHHYKAEKLTKFYLSEKVDGVCTFKDITEDLEPMYSLLAEPMERIDFLDSYNSKPSNG